jgi:hypothetical protein
MKSRVVLISALLAFVCGTAQADVITVRQPTIIRGSSQHCHAKQPHVINVRQALKNSNGNICKCVAGFRHAHRERITSITNVIVIARRRERVYIKFN